MTLLKKLDQYTLQKFLLIFVGAFFICLFVFMMQFTWRYVDELIGKGLSLTILGQFFWYMGLTLVPQALPLAILLASLITFGNMGESFELLAMKAAGVSLVRIMRPMALVAALMTGVSFYFQNSTSPHAQVSLTTLLVSMKQQSPAVEIPEGVFYNGVPNINIFVQHKNAATGMLYQTIIYKTDQGFDRAQIVLADSARLEMTADKLHLKLDLWNGELFESLQGSGTTGLSQSGTEQPYDRETFTYKQLLIDFDSNFNMMDKDLLSGMPQAKNMLQIAHSVDSMELRQDSVGRALFTETGQRYFPKPTLKPADSLHIVRALAAAKPGMTFDDLLAHTAPDKVMRARQSARQNVLSMKSDLEWRKINTDDTAQQIRRHWVEWHQKMTLSLACIIFFFVGAPLGAIIRKGGLGLPTVISVIIFIIWYVINTSGMKMARDGNINMTFGMWVSLIVIAPFGAFITYKANHDSTVFNLEAYTNFFRRLLGLRTKRHLYVKEVIITDPRRDVVLDELSAIRSVCEAYGRSHHLLRAPGYIDTFFRYRPDTEIENLDERLEALIEELSNSRNPKIIAQLNNLPILYARAHTSPFHSRRLNIAAGIVFPLGFVLWLRIWRFRLWLARDLRTILRVTARLESLISGEAAGAEAEAAAEAAERSAHERKARRRRLIKRIVLGLILLAIVAFGARFGWEHWRQYRLKARPQTTQPASAQPAEPDGNRQPEGQGPLRLDAPMKLGQPMPGR